MKTVMREENQSGSPGRGYNASAFIPAAAVSSVANWVPAGSTGHPRRLYISGFRQLHSRVSN